MKPRMLWVLLLFSALWGRPAAADNRFSLRPPCGLLSLQPVCWVLGCNVSGGLDGSLGKLFLVTAPALIDPNVFLQTLRSQPGISRVELDALLKVMQAAATAPPSGLSDNTPAPYFVVTLIHVSIRQPAFSIIRLPNTQTAFTGNRARTLTD